MALLYHFDYSQISPFDQVTNRPFHHSTILLFFHFTSESFEYSTILAISPIDQVTNLPFHLSTILPFHLWVIWTLNHFTILPPSPAHLNTFVFIRGAIFIFWVSTIFLPFTSFSFFQEKKRKRKTKTHFRTRLVFFLFFSGKVSFLFLSRIFFSVEICAGEFLIKWEKKFCFRNNFKNEMTHLCWLELLRKIAYKIKHSHATSYNPSLRSLVAGIGLPH